MYTVIDRAQEKQREGLREFIFIQTQQTKQIQAHSGIACGCRALTSHADGPLACKPARLTVHGGKAAFEFSTASGTRSIEVAPSARCSLRRRRVAIDPIFWLAPSCAHCSSAALRTLCVTPPRSVPLARNRSRLGGRHDTTTRGDRAATTSHIGHDVLPVRSCCASCTDCSYISTPRSRVLPRWNGANARNALPRHAPVDLRLPQAQRVPGMCARLGRLEECRRTDAVPRMDCPVWRHGSDAADPLQAASEAHQTAERWKVGGRVRPRS